MTAITNLEIVTQRLQGDIENLRMHLNGMRQTGSKMMSNINALSSMWEGEAKDAFTAQFQSDYETLQSMAEVVENLIGHIEYAREQYDTCESNVASIVHGIRV